MEDKRKYFGDTGGQVCLKELNGYDSHRWS